MDPDPQIDPQDPDEQSELSRGDSEAPAAAATSDAAPAEDDEAEAGAATSDEPAASDAYGHDPAQIGDYASPDVDLSGLTSTYDDGDPDDDEDPA